MNRRAFIAVSVVAAALFAGVSTAIAPSTPASSYETASQQADQALTELQKQNDLAHVFERVAVALRPSVVAIASTRELEPRGTLRLHGRMPGLEGRFFGGPRGEGEGQPREHGIGSGVIVSADGYILTNNHVVDHSTDLKVYLCDDREFSAKLVGADAKTDLAVIKIDARELHPATLADSEKLKVGQWVAAFGAPFGLDQTISSGIVSAKGRSNLHIAEYEDFIQTDAAINPGNSGGPLVDLDGHVVGIDAAIVSQNGGSQGVGFAIASNLARSIMDRLIHEGKVVRGWLGVSIQELTPDLARSFGGQGLHGVLIGDVTSGSPAEHAGLRPGDVITQVDGADLKSLTSFRGALAESRPGKQVKLSIVRDGKPQTIDVEVGTWPDSAPEVAASADPAPSGFGLELLDLNPRVAAELGLEEDVHGVVIANVLPDSVADNAGLRAGDRIIAVEREDVRDAEDAARKIRAHLKDGVLLRIRREGASRWLRLPGIV